MAQVSAACSITLLTHVAYTRPLVRRVRLWLVRRGAVGRICCHKHICGVLQLPARNHHQQGACLLGSRNLGQPQASTSFTVLPSIGCAIPSHQAHLKPMPGSISCVSNTSSNHSILHCYQLLSNRLHVQISLTGPNSCQTQISSSSPCSPTGPSSPSLISMSSTLPKVPPGTQH